MKLNALLEGFGTVESATEVTGLSLDSRSIKAGHVFVALPGKHKHGLSYTHLVKAAGAVATLFDPDLVTDRDLENLNDDFLVPIEQLNDRLGFIAARFYANPSQKLHVIGITGTNGKTSCSQFLGQLLDHCGIIGTLGWGTWGDLSMTGYTTPDALSTQGMLRDFVHKQCEYVAMEVSSHGIAEGRINAVRFKGVVLTNISRDHLDFHGSMAAYIETKLALFTKTDTDFAIINLDDVLSKLFIEAIPESVRAFGYSAKGNICAAIPTVTANNIKPTLDGLSFDLGWQHEIHAVKVPFYGTFNVENVLAVVSVLLALGFNLRDIVPKLGQLKPVNGRMQRFGNERTPLIFIDYAHTPDALEKVLQSARAHCQRNLWLVFGCGGDRDVGKRPQMGLIAEQLADRVVVTNDNPRSENSESIVKDILSGCQNPDNTQCIYDRAEAINYALQQLSEHDCLVIAGKGHEDYQEIGSQKFPFSDAAVVNQWVNEGALTA